MINNKIGNNNMDKKIIKNSFLLALGEAVYITLVALLMFSIQKLFGEKPDPVIIAPIAFLLLLVISAAISGALIFGKPPDAISGRQEKRIAPTFRINFSVASYIFSDSVFDCG